VGLISFNLEGLDKKLETWHDANLSTTHHMGNKLSIIGGLAMGVGGLYGLQQLGCADAPEAPPVSIEPTVEPAPASGSLKVNIGAIVAPPYTAPEDETTEQFEDCEDNAARVAASQDFAGQIFDGNEELVAQINAMKLSCTDAIYTLGYEEGILTNPSAELNVDGPEVTLELSEGAAMDACASVKNIATAARIAQGPALGTRLDVEGAVLNFGTPVIGDSHIANDKLRRLAGETGKKAEAACKTLRRDKPVEFLATLNKHQGLIGETPTTSTQSGESWGIPDATITGQFYNGQLTEESAECEVLLPAGTVFPNSALIYTAPKCHTNGIEVASIEDYPAFSFDANGDGEAELALTPKIENQPPFIFPVEATGGMDHNNMTPELNTDSSADPQQAQFTTSYTVLGVEQSFAGEMLEDGTFKGIVTFGEGGKVVKGTFNLTKEDGFVLDEEEEFKMTNGEDGSTYSNTKPTSGDFFEQCSGAPENPGTLDAPLDAGWLCVGAVFPVANPETGERLAIETGKEYKVTWPSLSGDARKATGTFIFELKDDALVPTEIPGESSKWRAESADGYSCYTTAGPFTDLTIEGESYKGMTWEGTEVAGVRPTNACYWDPSLDRMVWIQMDIPADKRY
jgi:hypothetical protein